MMTKLWQQWSFMTALIQWNKKKRIWTSDIEEMAKDLIPLAESTNAGEALMTTDHDDKWEFIMGFRKKNKYWT